MSKNKNKLNNIDDNINIFYLFTVSSVYVIMVGGFL